MLRQFPLYDSLAKSDDYKYDSQEVCKYSKDLTEEQQEFIPALIYHYFLINNTQKTKKTAIPYQGKNVGAEKTGITWSFENLPLDLQRIIARYIHYLVQK